MRRVRRWAVGVLGVVAAGLVAVQFRATAEYRDALACQAEAGARLDDALRCRHDCSELQRQLVAELAHGRVPLAAAAGLLLDANQARPDWLDGLDSFYPDEPDRRARAARTLVASVATETRDDPSRQAEALGRLSAELDRMTNRSD